MILLKIKSEYTEAQSKEQILNTKLESQKSREHKKQF